MTITAANAQKDLDLPTLMQAPLRLAHYVGKGHTSGEDISLEIYAAQPGSGIVFVLPHQGGLLALPATCDAVVNTLRNVVIGQGRTRLCIVEHFLCAAALWGLDDVLVHVDGMEMPLGDGSSLFWLQLFEAAGLPRKTPEAADIELLSPIEVSKGDRAILIVPSEAFSASYLMDWDHPKIGKIWKTWDLSQSIHEVADARTFGSMAEQQMMGLDQAEGVVCLTQDGFSKPLRFEDEPVRHKLLDLIGDLILCGVNPLRIKARFISIKGGHELDVMAAKKLKETLALNSRQDK